LSAWPTAELSGGAGGEAKRHIQTRDSRLSDLLAPRESASRQLSGRSFRPSPIRLTSCATNRSSFETFEFFTFCHPRESRDMVYQRVTAIPGSRFRLGREIFKALALA